MRTLLIVLVATAAAAEDGPVRAALEWEPGTFGHWRYHERPLAETAPDGVKLPEGVAQPRYGSLELHGGRVVHLVIDVAPDSHRLWVDTDLDRDLAEERPRAWLGADTVRSRETILLDVGATEPLPVDVTFWRASLATVDGFKYLANVHRAGSVVVGERVRRMTVVDGNGDFRFDDPEHDRIFLDVDGSGVIASIRGGHEQIAIGEPFHVRGRGYVATVTDPLAAVVEFREVRPVPPPRPRFVETWDPVAPRTIEDKGDAALADLEAKYEAADAAARVAIVRDVARLGTREAFDFLERVAGEGGAGVVRQWAVDGMGFTDYRPFAARLAKFAEPPHDPAIRKLAVLGLHRMDAPGREKLFHALLQRAATGEEKPVVAYAAKFLAQAGTPEARKLLVKAMRAQKEPVLRSQIYYSAKHGDPGGLQPALVKAALGDPDPALHGDALWDYWGFEPEKARAHAMRVVADEEVTRHALLYPAMKVLGFHGDKKAIPVLLDRADVGSDRTWQLVIDLLAPVRDPDAVREIAAGLRHRDPRVRSACAHILENNRSDAVAAALAKAAKKEKERDVLWRLATALANQEGNKAVAALLRIGKDDDFPAARSIALAGLARMGFDDRKVARMFRAMLASPRWEDRIFALDAVARAGDSAAAPKVLASLGHKVWQVRLAAVQALRSLRVVDAIPALIARLEKEEERRIRIEIADTLFSLTGREFYDDADGWQRWWEAHREGFTVPAEVPQRVVAEGATVARFYGVPVVSDRVCFVLDRSGSMDSLAGDRTRLARATDELLAAVEKLDRRARCNVVLFASRVRSWKKGLAAATKSNRADLREYLAAVAPGGDTNLYGGLHRAFADETVDTIFLLSDGAPNEGMYTHPEAILREVRALNATRRVAIHTISIGRDSELLRRLAEENGGAYARR